MPTPNTIVHQVHRIENRCSKLLKKAHMAELQFIREATMPCVDGIFESSSLSRSWIKSARAK